VGCCFARSAAGSQAAMLRVLNLEDEPSLPGAVGAGVVSSSVSRGLRRRSHRPPSPRSPSPRAGGRGSCRPTECPVRFLSAARPIPLSAELTVVRFPRRIIRGARSSPLLTHRQERRLVARRRSSAARARQPPRPPAPPPLFPMPYGSSPPTAGQAGLEGFLQARALTLAISSK
jgi:hypothetical protein